MTRETLSPQRVVVVPDLDLLDPTNLLDLAGETYLMTGRTPTGGWYVDPVETVDAETWAEMHEHRP